MLFDLVQLWCVVAVTAEAASLPGPAGPPAALAELETKIKEGMAKYRIPGVALGLRLGGRDYLRGYGVTSVADPHPVDGDTVFRIASNTKPFTGTAVMRLVDQGRLDLDRTVRSYLPDFRTADEAASARVTVRQVLQHTGGWLGDFFLNTGSDDGALARYVAAMSRVPQLTDPGTVFAYCNSCLALAGRLIEVVTGMTYEQALHALVINPLRLNHTAFSLDEMPDAQAAVAHVPDEQGNPVAHPELPIWTRSVGPAGGLYSSARNLLSWARFHLGDGRPLLNNPRLFHMMKSKPGPGGTLFVELNGMGITWMLRPTAEGTVVVQHGGDLTGHHSGFLMVPEQDFALTVLTNSETGPSLLAELFADDWALSRLAGLHNLPAPPGSLPDAELAEYAGRYTSEQIGFDGETLSLAIDLVPDQGRLGVKIGELPAGILQFYRRDYVHALLPSGTDTFSRANFVRGQNGTITFFRFGGRLYRRTLLATSIRPTAAARLQVALPYLG